MSGVQTKFKVVNYQNKDSAISVQNAWCNLCYKEINIGGKGVSALDSHAEGKNNMQFRQDWKMLVYYFLGKVKQISVKVPRWTIKIKNLVYKRKKLHKGETEVVKVLKML